MGETVPAVPGISSFEKKFGRDFISTLPGAPGVYLFYPSAKNDGKAPGEQRPCYVGKAKNLRRRISQYRNAKRIKKHHKMREIIKSAERVEISLCESEREACLLEMQLIQKHRPRWNVSGAFSFMYPMVGAFLENDVAYFCYTTVPEEHSRYQFHGAFRSREVTWGAFYSLMQLLSYVGHPVPRKHIGERTRYTYRFAFRQIDPQLLSNLERFWKGESLEGIEHLILSLLEHASARKARKEVQASIDALKRFWKHEALPLASARRMDHYDMYPVPQKERDPLFLRCRYTHVTGEASTKKCDSAQCMGPGQGLCPSFPAPGNHP